MIGEYRRFNREARTLLRDGDDPYSLGDWLDERFSRRVRPAADRPPGLGRVVGRPRPDVVLPRPLPRAVLRAARDARADRPAAVAHGGRRLGALRRGADRAVRATASALAHPGRAGRAARRRRAGDPPRRRGRALRRGRHRHALRPGAGACSATPRPTASTRSSARSPTSTTRRSCTPTARLLPRRRAAWSSLELPPARRADRAVDRHLPHEHAPERCARARSCA